MRGRGRGGGACKDGRRGRREEGRRMGGGGREHGRGGGRGGGRRRGEDWRVRGGPLRFGVRLSVGRPVQQRPLTLLRVLRRHGEQSLLHVVPEPPALREPAVHLCLGQPGLLGQLVCSGTQCSGSHELPGSARTFLGETWEFILSVGSFKLGSLKTFMLFLSRRHLPETGPRLSRGESK